MTLSFMSVQATLLCVAAAAQVTAVLAGLAAPAAARGVVIRRGDQERWHRLRQSISSGQTLRCWLKNNDKDVCNT